MAGYSHYPKALRPKSKKVKEKQRAQRQRVRSDARQAAARKKSKAKDKWGNVKKTAKSTGQDAVIGASLLATRGRSRGKGGATPYPKTMKEAGLKPLKYRVQTGTRRGYGEKATPRMGSTPKVRGRTKTYVQGLSSKGNPSITERRMGAPPPKGTGPNTGYPKAAREYKASLKEMRSRTEGKREAPTHKPKTRDTKSKSQAPTGRPRSKVSKRHKERKPVETKAQRAARELKRKTAQTKADPVPVPYKSSYGGPSYKTGSKKKPWQKSKQPYYRGKTKRRRRPPDPEGEGPNAPGPNPHKTAG